MSIIGLFVTVRLGFMVIYACLLSWFMIFCVYRVMFDIFLCLRTVLVSLWFMHCMYTYFCESPDFNSSMPVLCW